jgi:hypothetical protein
VQGSHCERRTLSDSDLSPPAPHSQIHTLTTAHHGLRPQIHVSPSSENQQHSHSLTSPQRHPQQGALAPPPPSNIRRIIFELAAGGYEILLCPEWPETPLVHRRHFRVYPHEVVYPDPRVPHFYRKGCPPQDPYASPTFSWDHIAALNQTCTQMRRETTGMHIAYSSWASARKTVWRSMSAS